MHKSVEQYFQREEPPGMNSRLFLSNFTEVQSSNPHGSPSYSRWLVSSHLIGPKFNRRPNPSLIGSRPKIVCSASVSAKRVPPPQFCLKKLTLNGIKAILKAFYAASSFALVTLDGDLLRDWRQRCPSQSPNQWTVDWCAKRKGLGWWQ